MIIREIFKRFFSTRALQVFYERLFDLSLFGGNIGRGNSISLSGEDYFLNYINKFFKNRTALTIFDVGTNTGEYIDLLLSKIKTDKYIHAFEPSITAFKSLRKKYGESINISLNNIGFGDRETNMKLYFPKDGSKLSSFIDYDLKYKGINDKYSYESMITRLDSYCISKAIKHINLLKIDVEGYDYFVLKGCGEMLNNSSIDFIQFEFGNSCIQSKIFFKELFDLLSPSYRIYRLLPNSLFPIKKYDEKLEIFIRATIFIAINNTLFQGK